MTATISRVELDELKSRVDLVELVRSCGLELKRKGKNWFCRCPFHADGDASLSINPAKQLWKCFGCETGGDALRFLELHEKLDFGQAVGRLRELSGTLPSTQKAAVKKLTGGFDRRELLERAVELYQQALWESPEAQDALRARGLVDEGLWRAFRIGYCDGTALARWTEQAETRLALQAVGLCNETGAEHFRGCLVVPLGHPDLGTASLYGRRLQGESRHLMLAGPCEGVLNWQALKASPAVVVAEGVWDALALWQAGVREATCLLGLQGPSPTLTELLRRFEVREVTLCLDGDESGRQAQDRFSVSFAELDLSVFQVTLPDELDPNEVLVQQGPEALRTLVQARRALPPVSTQQEKPAEHDKDGFRMELGNVVYVAQPLPPFTGRLRVSLRAHRGERWLQDRFDFAIHRDRVRLTGQLVSQLGISRLEAERHHLALLRQAEGWVRGQKVGQEPQQNPKDTMSAAQRQAGMDFLTGPKLVQNLLGDMEALGYVGEENAKVLAYLIGVSRKLPKPLSGIVISQSGCGKSTLTDLVEQLTPPEEVLVFTRITAQALVYMAQEMLTGKLLIVEERTGAEAAEYSIRVLQSRQELAQAVPLKDPATGKITTQIIVVKGPVAYLETTTDPKINHENATRCFEITLDESEEQTQRIQESQRNRRLPSAKNRVVDAQAIREKHHAAQRLLENVQVFIPYADQLTFPSKRLRTRRDNERFLSLVEASAFFHQHQRERGELEDGTAYVLANLEDYALAYTLARDVLEMTLHELSRGARDIWLAVRDWVRAEAGGSLEREFTFSRRDLRQILSVEDHQLREALQELVEMEYLEALSGSQGRAFLYRLQVFDESGAPSGLLSPMDLENKLRGALQKSARKGKA